MAVPFNLARLEVTQDNPVAVLTGIGRSTGPSGAEYAVAPGGELVYVPSSYAEGSNKGNGDVNLCV